MTNDTKPEKFTGADAQALTRQKIQTDLMSPSWLSRLAEAYPDEGFRPERYARQAINLCLADPKLMDAATENRASLFGAVMQAAEMGLELTRASGEAWLVPYRIYDKRLGRKVPTVQFQPGYRGMLRLVRQTGCIAAIFAEVRREADPWKIRRGDSPRLYHAPDYDLPPEERGPMLGAYAVAKFTNGGTEWVYLPGWKISKAKAASRGSDSATSPWTVYPEEMAEKTALRALCKRLPLTGRAAQVVDADERVAMGEEPDLVPAAGDVDEGEVDPLSEVAQAWDASESAAEDRRIAEAEGVGRE